MVNIRYRAQETVKEVGAKVMASRQFQEADLQTHHHFTTVARHSFRVACICFCICHFLYVVFKIKTNWQLLIVCALLHDIGIIGRDLKYRNNSQCCQQHPKDSVVVAQSILGDLDDTGRDIIGNHMWPMTLTPPQTIEGFIITIADKYCAVTDLLPMNNRSRLINPSFG
ncbi:MAG: HD domain-containing protein [Butyrivibrio sp.]|uniref:HD domain-containing protein n=1 Tax=Butyrivibrio sp. TaxID=28121 RepID=UPI0025DC0029|nr:HD domain-containing protein [Butyrivibrio sp.]MCR5772026.1 HD domain-containing protein [Butyrivibrio sp.]